MRAKKRKAEHLILGAKGEKLAVRLAKELGLDVLCCNYRISGGEIDIIALDETAIIFIEVKSRDEKRIQFLDRPADAVDHNKKRRLRKAAKHYLRRVKNKNIAYRFDVVEMIFSGKRLKASYWLKEYFTMTPELELNYGYDFE